jgi:hypothetical protein
MDSDIDTRYEALVGLAERRDADVLEMIEDELRAETVQRLAVDAARAFADRGLLAPLEALLPWWNEDRDLLLRAIATCRSGEQED